MRPSPGTTFYQLGILLLTLTVGSLCQAQTLGEALNAANLNWTTGGGAPWLAETNITHDGQAAVTTGNLPFGQANWIQTTVTGPTAVNFWWKVSSCPDVPLLGLLIGGTLQTSIGGEIDWQQRSFYVPAGAQTLEWTFTLNCASSGAQNMGWLDQMSFSAPVPLAIVSQPTNQTVTAGNPFSFSVTATGTEPFTYQWQHAGTNLPGATGSSFSVADAQAAHAGDYVVVVTGPLGVVTSQVARLIVTPTAPLFTIQPVSQGAAIGSTMRFTAAAKGSEPLGGWQWYSNGVAVAGASFATLSITNVQTSSFGGYWVVVTNAYGSSTSLVATLSYSPLVAWGASADSETFVPPGATNILAMAGGDLHCLALRADGTVLAWGGNYIGQATVPPDATNVVSIAAGSTHSLAVRDDGTVLLWGETFGNVTNVPAGLTNAAAVALGPGAQHVLTLLKDRTVVEWGGNYSFHPSLTNVPATATNIVSVAAGAFHSVALRADGTVLAWGDNSQLQTAVPANATNVVAISAGWYHSLALRANGTLVTWGGGVALPTGVTNIVAIACGGNHSLALRADGQLLAWGNNYYGQATPPRWATNIVAIAGTSVDSLALIGDGPPLLASPAMNRSVLAGGTAYFRAAAVCAWPLSFQWQLYGTNLPGATGAVLVISNAQPAQAGPYSVVVSNALGTASGLAGSLAILAKESVIATDSLTMTNGQFSFRASGPAGLKWSVQASTNLVDWLDLATLTNSTGTMRFNAPATNFIQCFYRLRLVP